MARSWPIAIERGGKSATWRADRLIAATG